MADQRQPVGNERATAEAEHVSVPRAGNAANEAERRDDRIVGREKSSERPQNDARRTLRRHDGGGGIPPLFGDPADQVRHRGQPGATSDPRPAPPPRPPPRVPTIFVECTHTYHTDLNTGIQRVVRNVTRYASDAAARYGYAVVPVILEGSALVPADPARVQEDKLRLAGQVLAGGTSTGQAEGPDAPFGNADTGSESVGLARFVWRLGLRLIVTVLPFEPVRRLAYAPPYQRGLARSLLFALRAIRIGVRVPALVVPPATGGIGVDRRADCSGDVLLLLDSSWGAPVWPAVKRFKERGGRVVGVIYDLIPVTHSDTCLPSLVSAFDAWLRNHGRFTDAFVAISRSTACEVRRYFAAAEPARRDLPVGHFHLGSELDFIAPDEPVRTMVREIFERERHVFLVVGSIDPRKNHGFILDAFDRFWADGGQAALVLVGRYGWKSDALLGRVAAHPAFGRQLYLLRDIADTELDYAYRNASALVTASKVEGFGLPVVEALQRGLPVLCSDIPVFREIADGKATFFALDEPGSLTAALHEFCRARRPADRWRRTPHQWLSWRESTEQLVAAAMEVLSRTAVREPTVLGHARSPQE